MSEENITPNEEQEIVQETQETVASIEEQLKEELQQEKDKYLRMYAEFENYKKRTTKERLELYTTASESVLIALLPIIDDFERAIAQLEKQENTEQLHGVQLIYNKFKDTLSSKGLEDIVIEKGSAFDADFAEAVTQIPAGDDMKGKIVDVIEKGYKLGEKIIRYPKVVTGQ
ncbi:nucleotide exchange factor GrpE [Capnocytophaga sp. ARDL2]|uniref:nucleotide exchange factor GrpE n=1 Tax=Capnocytophaga sp. ARDL2 TaxID=3238809 RepID=UPI003558C098